MLSIIVRWLVALFQRDGTIQIGREVQSAADANVEAREGSTVIVGQGNTIFQGSLVHEKEPDDGFALLEKQISELLGEMRQDLAQHPMAREFIILSKSWLYNHDPNKITLMYYFEDHADLRNKLRILENHGLIREITNNRVERFTFGEDLVAYLLAER